MDIALLIISSALSLLCLVALIVVLVLLLKKNKGGSPLNSDFENRMIASQTKLDMTVDNLQKTVMLKIEGQMGEMSAKVEKQLREEGEKTNDKFNAISESLNGKVAAINENVLKRFQETTDMEQKQIDRISAALNGITEKNDKKMSEFQMQFSKAVSEQLIAMNTKLESSFKDINAKVDASLLNGFKTTGESMAALQKQLGAVEEAQRNLQGLQNDIATLNGVLTSNQQRGKYGEWQLELLLENLFEDGKGTLYDLQFNLGDGLKPDAVIFLDGKARHQIICIDSKFSLTGYEALFDPSVHLSEDEEKEETAKFKSALKARIDETSKYIVPGKTIGNALMFIPSDGVFAFVEKEFLDLVDAAKRKHVILVCPCIMTPLLSSFRVIQLDAARSESLSLINASLNKLAKDFKNFIPRWEALNKGIQSLTKKSEEFSTTVGKIGKSFDKVERIDLQDNQKDEAEENPNALPAIDQEE